MLAERRLQGDRLGAVVSPAVGGLADVLQDRQQLDPLSGSGGGDLVEVWERCDVRDLIETEEHGGRVQALCVAAVGGVADLLEQVRHLALGGVDNDFRIDEARGADHLLDHLAAQLPASPFLYEPQQRSDLAQGELLAELIREQVLRRTFQELPHAVGVVVEEIEPDPANPLLTRVDALIWVETESQKSIVVGHGGHMIKAIGTAARHELERELDGRVHLSLAVRVRRHWRGDDSLLDRLGID